MTEQFDADELVVASGSNIGEAKFAVVYSLTDPTYALYVWRDGQWVDVTDEKAPDCVGVTPM